LRGAAGASRVWVHTCTLDHPGALPNYIARGFRVYKEETDYQELTGQHLGLGLVVDSTHLKPSYRIEVQSGPHAIVRG